MTPHSASYPVGDRLTPEQARAVFDDDHARREQEAELASERRPDRLTPETPLARYERQGGGPLDGPGMLYRKEPGGGYAHVSRDVDDLVCFAAALQRRVKAYEEALVSAGPTIGRVYPRHIQAWGEAITKNQGYESVLSAWLTHLGNALAALAAKPEEETT